MRSAGTVRRFDLINLVREWAADCRFAFRTCRRDWRLASLICVMIAFGVGSAAAVFSMVDQLLLQPPAGVHTNAGGSVAYLEFLAPGAGTGTSGQDISVASFDQVRGAATSLSGLASYGLLDAVTVSVGNNHPIEADGNTIYGDFFEILGVRPSAGRLLYASDTELSEDPRRIVISESLRNKLFGSAAAVGRSVSLNGIAFTVLGVTADGFVGPERGSVADFWIPSGASTLLYGFDLQSLSMRSMLVRTRAGVTLAEATAQMTEITHHLTRAPEERVPDPATLHPTLFPGLATPPIIRGHTHRTMSLLIVIATMVFLIVCANMSNLLLVRSLKRRTMTATLLAIGASRMRVARQQMALSVLLGLAGAAAGIPVAWAICSLLNGGTFVAMPVFSGLHFDRALFLFVPLAGVIAGALCGALPAVLATRLDLASALRAGAVTHSGQRGTIRVVFSTAQLAMSLTLIVGALLLLHTIRNLYSIRTGMDTEGVLALSLERSSRLSPAETDALYRRVVAAVRVLPSVESAALDPYGLPADVELAKIALAGAPATKPMTVSTVSVTPGLLHVLRIPIVSGRSFQEADWTFARPSGVVLTASLARKLFGTTNVAGRQVALPPSEQETVLGVTGDIRSPGSDAPEDVFFTTYGDIRSLRSWNFTLLVRARRADPQMAQRVRAAVQDVLPNEAIPDARLLPADVSRSYSEPLLLTRLLSLLALFGVAVATVGLYGGIAATVEDRRRELAIRLALGAKPIDIGRMVAIQTAAIVSVGTVVGLGGAYALARVLRSELFDVGSVDPLSYVTAVFLLAAVMAMATTGPTRRAMRIDPMRALRES